MLRHLMQAPPGVPPGDQDGVVVGRELLGGELPDGLQQPETPTEPAGLDEQHRPLDQLPQQVVDSGEVRSATVPVGRVGGNAAGGRDVERPGEDRQPPEEDLLGSGEQVVGPPDGGPQRPVPFGAGPAATGQQLQAIAEPGHQIRRGEGSAARRGQLDGQRDAVQATADLLDIGPGGGRIERHADRPRPLVEQLGAPARPGPAAPPEGAVRRRCRALPGTWPTRGPSGSPGRWRGRMRRHRR